MFWLVREHRMPPFYTEKRKKEKEREKEKEVKCIFIDLPGV